MWHGVMNWHNLALRDRRWWDFKLHQVHVTFHTYTYCHTNTGACYVTRYMCTRGPGKKCSWHEWGVSEQIIEICSGLTFIWQAVFVSEVERNVYSGLVECPVQPGLAVTSSGCRLEFSLSAQSPEQSGVNTAPCFPQTVSAHHTRTGWAALRRSAK